MMHKPCTETGLFVVASLLLGACGSEPKREQAVENPTVREYLDTLPPWEDFSPPLAASEPAIDEQQEPITTVETVEDVEIVDENEEVKVVGDVTYDCSETPYSLTQNPQELIISDPNRDVLYAGAMIQGKSHRDGVSIGDVLPLTVPKRSKIRVSIPDVANAESENFRLVQPNQGEVSEAVGNIIGNATKAGVPTPSSISFEMKTYHSESQFALEAGVSGRYLGFKAKASGSIERDASKTTVAVQFTERMYTVAVEPPGSGPETFFSQDFDRDDMERLVDLGVLGPDNLPIYVSSVVYGRMMTFALTSTASESELKAAISASYKTFAGGVSGSVSTRQQKILSESSVVVTTLGGDSEAALRAVRTGDWSEYFTEEANLSTAVPLSYTFKNLSDSSIAAVSETTEYTVKTCKARQLSPGLFDVQEPLDIASNLAAINDLVLLDENGDQLTDVALNQRSAGVNAIAILNATGEGSFSLGVEQEHSVSAPRAAWPAYQLAAGNIDDDGDDDLVWNYNGDIGGNILYAWRAGDGADGGFEELEAPQPPYVHPSYAGGSYHFLLGDINGDGRADPIWSSVGVRPESNFAHAGLALGDGRFRLEDGTYEKHSSSDGWLAYVPLLGDYNGDGLTDLAFSRFHHGHVFLAADANRDADIETVGLGTVFEQGALSLVGPEEAGSVRPGDLTGLARLVGDIDLDGRADMVSIYVDEGASDAEYPQVYAGVAFGTAEGFEPQTTGLVAMPLDRLGETVDVAHLDFALANVGGDGRADLIINHRYEAINRVLVGLSNGDGSFDYSSAEQDIPISAQDVSWGQYQMIVGDFGGSGEKDLAWILKGSPVRIHVALAK